MDNQIKTGSAREPYEPPAIEDIPLRPEEQLLAGCKTPTGGSQVSGGNPCVQCMTVGSS
ncbi:MAG: hypothetical protein JWL71_2903 [Acidobacteria bacterium]|nr:hypothetical protein [Acidobacteriota bacterium]